MLQHGWKIVLLYLIFLFFIHHGRKIGPVLYIYPSAGTENNTELYSLYIIITVDEFCAKHIRDLCCSDLQQVNYHARMDDDLYMMNDFASRSDIPSIRQHPVHVKVCGFTSFFI